MTNINVKQSRDYKKRNENNHIKMLHRDYKDHCPHLSIFSICVPQSRMSIIGWPYFIQNPHYSRSPKRASMFHTVFVLKYEMILCSTQMLCTNSCAMCLTIVHCLQYICVMCLSIYMDTDDSHTLCKMIEDGNFC